MNSGSPPTAPKARAGLLTPPGISRLARTNAARLRSRLIRGFGGWLMVNLRRQQFGELLFGFLGDVGEFLGRVIAVEVDDVAGDLFLRAFVGRVCVGWYTLDL